MSEAVTELAKLYLLGGPMHGKVVQIERRNPLRITLPKPENEDIPYGPEVLHYEFVASFDDGSELARFVERQQVTKREWKKAQEGIADDGR